MNSKRLLLKSDVRRRAADKHLWKAFRDYEALLILAPVAEILSAYRHCYGLALTLLKEDSLEALEFLDRSLAFVLRKLDIYLSDLISIVLACILDYK